MPHQTLATYFHRVSDMGKYFETNSSTGSPTAGTTVGREPLLSDADRDIAELVISFITLFVSLLGVVTNSINLRVFLKQGVMSDSITIGFFALAIADFLVCFTALPQSLCVLYKMMERLVDYINCQQATLMTSQYPRIVFSRISCWVNVYIAIERCLCVLMPLKVKILIRPKTTASIMISIYLFFGFFHLPLGVSTSIVWQFSEKFNQSVIAVLETPFGEKALYYQSLIGTTILSSVALVIVALTTRLLIHRLNLSRNWSMSVSTAGATGTENGAEKTKTKSRKRDQEAMKTVSAITGMFLACLSMSHIPAMAALAIPGFSITGQNTNLLMVLFDLKCLFDGINSAANFFFYVKISSRYKTAFNAVFQCGEHKK